jgi:hypothetical protein
MEDNAFRAARHACPAVRKLFPRVTMNLGSGSRITVTCRPGKTIEADLVMQELLRYRARAILIVCPAGFRLQ